MAGVVGRNVLFRKRGTSREWRGRKFGWKSPGLDHSDLGWAHAGGDELSVGTSQIGELPLFPGPVEKASPQQMGAFRHGGANPESLIRGLHSDRASEIDCRQGGAPQRPGNRVSLAFPAGQPPDQTEQCHKNADCDGNTGQPENKAASSGGCR